MRKIIALGIMLLFLGMTISSSTGLNVEKQSIKPMSSGNILYVGGNGTGNYSSIQDAIDNSSDGDTVFVYNGTYYEYVDVDKSISLIGENKNTTIIDGSGSGDVVYVRADWVNVSGFSIQNSGNDAYNAGFFITSSFCLITNNIIFNNYCGIRFVSSSNNIIRDNIIKFNHRYGLRILHSSNFNIIKNNIILNNGWAGIFFLWNSNYNQILYNIIHNNDEGIYTSQSLNCDIIGNEIINSSSYGIKIGESSGFVLNYNIIQKSTYGGIHLSSSSNISVKGNVISESYQ